MNQPPLYNNNHTPPPLSLSACRSLTHTTALVWIYRRLVVLWATVPLLLLTVPPACVLTVWVGNWLTGDQLVWALLWTVFLYQGSHWSIRFLARDNEQLYQKTWQRFRHKSHVYVLLVAGLLARCMPSQLCWLVARSATSWSTLRVVVGESLRWATAAALLGGIVLGRMLGPKAMVRCSTLPLQSPLGRRSGWWQWLVQPGEMPGQLVFFGAASSSRHGSTALSFSVLVAQVLWAVTLGWMVQLVVDVGRTPPTYLQDTEYSNNTNWYAQGLVVAPPLWVLLLSFGVLYLAVSTSTTTSRNNSNTIFHTTAYFQLDPQMPPPTLRGTMQLAGPVAVITTLLWTLSNTSHDALCFSCLSVAISAFAQSLYLLGLEQVVRYQLVHHSPSADTTSNAVLSLVHELWVDPAVCEAVFVYSLLQTPQTSLVLASTSSGNLTIQQLETLAAEWAVDSLDHHHDHSDALEHTVWQCALLDALAAEQPSPSKPQRNRQQHINVHWRETMYRALCVYVCGMGHVLVRCSNSNTSSSSHQEHSATRWNHITHTTSTWVCPPTLWYACTRAVHALRRYSNNETTTTHHLGHDLALARHSVQTLQQAVVGLQQKQQPLASSTTVLANSNNTMDPQVVSLLRECRTVLESFFPPSSRQ